jgi:dihydrofolate synthase/folylpolyglutamate synthase
MEPEPGRRRALQDWLTWQECLCPRSINLGLERVQLVLARMGWDVAPWPVITVAGTNGKGSCVAFLEAIMTRAGLRVAAYSSPHVVRYNERVRLGMQEASDQELCDVFAAVERARGEVPLTYFEFGTLAALEHFREAGPDIAVLEVGLGGRLDAVNAVDADAALITSVGIDHVGWLGHDRESIGCEKAGIFRPGKPAVCGDPAPPASLLAYAERMGAPLYCAGRDFDYLPGLGSWSWQVSDRAPAVLPLPGLVGAHQLRNAACALMVLEQLGVLLPPVPQEAILDGVRSTRLPGRFQVLCDSPELVLDGAHNPDAAAALAETLAGRPCAGRTRAVLGALADKDIGGIVSALLEVVDLWSTVRLRATRAESAERIGQRLAERGRSARVFDALCTALRSAWVEAAPGDRIVVFGSFYAVGEALACIERGHIPGLE